MKIFCFGKKSPLKGSATKKKEIVIREIQIKNKATNFRQFKEVSDAQTHLSPLRRYTYS